MNPYRYSPNTNTGGSIDRQPDRRVMVTVERTDRNRVVWVKSPVPPLMTRDGFGDAITISRATNAPGSLSLTGVRFVLSGHVDL